MSAAEAIRMAEANGIRLGIAGTDLILDADREPAPRVLDAIRRHKAGIVALLTTPGRDWSAEDWRAFFDERAGIAEYEGGEPREQAEVRAFECCIAEWMNRNPAPSDTDRCAWCRNAENAGSQVVPFGENEYGATWLHSSCWSAWYAHRREQAIEALAALGILRFVLKKHAE